METTKDKAPKETGSPSKKRFGDSDIPDYADANVGQKLEKRKAVAENRARRRIEKQHALRRKKKAEAER